MSRSHYGDMQFLHSMRPYGRNNSDTRQCILEWAEFCYRISIEQIDSLALLSAVDMPLITRLFPADSHYGKRSITHLFKTDKCPAVTSKRAMGSLLHMIQDSYSDLHTKRVINADGNRGAIIEFHNLIEQVDVKHVHVEAEAFPKKFESKAYSARHYMELIHKIEGGREAEKVGVQILQFMLNKESWEPRVRSFLSDEVFKMAGD